MRIRIKCSVRICAGFIVLNIFAVTIALNTQLFVADKMSGQLHHLVYFWIHFPVATTVQQALLLLHTLFDNRIAL